MFNCFKKRIVTPISKVEVIPDKDPNDFTLTASSTRWRTETYCPKCKSATEHSEKMANICNDCGAVFQCPVYLSTYWRSFRQIIQDGKWVYQYKYPKDEMEIVKERYW